MRVYRLTDSIERARNCKESAQRKERQTTVFYVADTD